MQEKRNGPVKVSNAHFLFGSINDQFNPINQVPDKNQKSILNSPKFK